MKTRTTGRVRRIGFAVLVFALAFLACGAAIAIASDIERRIPVVRDDADSGLTMEISREGTRQTATPVLTLNNPTVQKIENRIAKKSAGLAAKEISSKTTADDSLSRTGLGGTWREDSGRPGTNLSPRPQVPEEITVRGVQSFLKGLRASRKEKPVPVVVVAVPEQRLGRTDTAPRDIN